MFVNDVFDSVQGEGAWTGTPMTFLRLQGCNLSCPWCDTKQAIPLGNGAGRRFTVTELVTILDGRAPSIICVTGGEPLLQADELDRLIAAVPNKRWHVETNGTFPCYPPFNWVTVSPKPPRFWIEQQLERVGDELKFVITRDSDLDVALRFDGGPILINIQPVDNNERIAKQCVEFLAKTEFKSKWRLSYQIHKAIGVK